MNMVNCLVVGFVNLFAVYIRDFVLFIPNTHTHRINLPTARISSVSHVMCTVLNFWSEMGFVLVIGSAVE